MSSIRNRIAGRWRLVSYEASPESGATVYPLGAATAGVLDCSDEGNMSVHIMGAGYFHYSGYYTVDEKGSLTHHVELCSDRDLAGASSLRNAALEGARLVLSGSMDVDGKAHTVRVVWERHAE
ncbi:MAG: hypothetical protein EPO20_20650 [Betaproteobacteria bacterium]|nr:MAG: hypothetical protein EPO20_20650 [Betaproteobacteria bacterium]